MADRAGRLAGKTALITGGARGQGAREAVRFTEEGARVVIADIAVEEGRDLARSLPGASFVALDVADEAAWRDAMAVVDERFGRLDILVNNAGIHRRSAIVETSVASYMEVVRVNQLSVFLGMRAAIPAMRAHGGSIVNISSGAGMVGSANNIAYTATKWAIRGMTKTAALELAPYGIRVNSVHPGFIDTAMGQSGAGPGAGTTLDTVPMGRMGTVDEAASLVLFLASDESGYCTGAEFVCDGGITAGKRFVPLAR